MKKKKDKNKDREKKIKSADKVEKPAADEATQEHVKRLNRVIGQAEGIRKMLLDSRKHTDILVQCKAVHSALKSVETKLVKEHLENAISDISKADKKKRSQKIDALLELFKPVG